MITTDDTIQVICLDVSHTELISLIEAKLTKNVEHQKVVELYCKLWRHTILYPQVSAEDDLLMIASTLYHDTGIITMDGADDIIRSFCTIIYDGLPNDCLVSYADIEDTVFSGWALYYNSVDGLEGVTYTASRRLRSIASEFTLYLKDFKDRESHG